jgi:hypothetical protein
MENSKTNQTLEKKDSCENYNKMSRPSEKHLEKEKRNKRKSKVFRREIVVDALKLSDENTCQNSNYPEEVTMLPELDKRGNIFKDFKDYENIPSLNKCKFDYTLEKFDSLTVLDENDKEKENIRINSNLTEILKELCEDKTPSRFDQPFKDKNIKMSFSQRFRDSKGHDSITSKRFKI